MHNPLELEVVETKVPSWVASHILELNSTYNVAFEGFESETLDQLMRIDERKVGIDKLKQVKGSRTSKSRGIDKSELKYLQSSLNMEVEWARDMGGTYA